MTTPVPAGACPDCRGQGQVADCVDGMKFYRACRRCSTVRVCARCQGAGHTRGEACQACEGAGQTLPK